ncbi:hypothetical protein [Puia sp.]|uniref:hypothetical protein n=1 Tax=Puia sp. TaxID=2045100 RepID=UPI002F3EAE89
MGRWLLLTSAVLFVLGYAISRDIRFEKAYAGDLRNRVTGSRIVKDGGSPYFYKWSAADGLRYYDPQNFDDWRPSHMTSTPVMYRLLSPLVEMPQATISRCWLVLEYLMFAGIALWAFLRAVTPLQRQAVLLVFGLVLLTNGWKQHVANGQTYLCIPLFAMLFFAFWEKNGHPARDLAAGVAAACLVGIRPNTALFFVGFLFLIPFYPRRRLLWFCLPAVLLAGWTLFSSHERGLWQDYFHNVAEATKINQKLHPDIVHNVADPHYRKWEGIDTVETTRYMDHPPAPIYSENGNFFVLFNGIFHTVLSVTAMGVLALGAIGIVVLLFFLRLRGQPSDKPDLAGAALLGVCLFMIADLASPIYRHQYYTVQWIFPLLLAATEFTPGRKWIYVLLLVGLLLNCIHLPFVKMGQTIGEYGLLLGFLGMALTPRGFRDLG